MEAVQFSFKDKTLKLVKIPVPVITEPNQVLIKVAYAGVCGTDLHIMDGEFPCNESRPFTLGHESSGIVIDVGPNVNLFKKGDRVAINPNIGCGKCEICHLGTYNYCKNGGINTGIGLKRDGGWAQYVVVPDNQIQKIPDSITLEQAALTEPISCLTRGWDFITPVAIGQTILMLGAGIIGNLFASILHLQGHRKVIVSEPNEKRRTLLKKNTGFECITPEQLTSRQRSDPEYLFDVVMDCSGYSPAIEHGFTLLKPGGKLCLFGVAPPHDKISISPFDIIIKEIRIYGVNINPYTFPKAVALVEAMGDRYLKYENLGVQVFPLKDYEQAIKMLRKGEVTKAMFKV